MYVGKDGEILRFLTYKRTLFTIYKELDVRKDGWCRGLRDAAAKVMGYNFMVKVGCSCKS